MPPKNAVTINGSEILIRVPCSLQDELVSAIDLFLDGLPSGKPGTPSLTTKEIELVSIFAQITRFGFNRVLDQEDPSLECIECAGSGRYEDEDGNSRSCNFCDGTGNFNEKKYLDDRIARDNCSEKSK